MQITYCEQWSRNYLHPHNPLTEQQARERHQRNELYTALLGEPMRPNCFLEFSAYRSVCVEFLDQSLRTYRLYSFSEEDETKLFLEQVVIRQFVHATGAQSDGDVYYFKLDGRLFVEHYCVGATAPSVMISSEEKRADITHNWEPCPEFGHYEGLARFDRGIPALGLPAQHGWQP